MTTKIPPIEKILAEALDLHEKGVSLHSIVRTYPEYKAEIEELFASMATLSLEKEKVRVPAAGLERLLASLPEPEPLAVQKGSIRSPFTSFVSSIQVSTLRFVLPIAALALLTGGLILHKGNPNGPVAMTVPVTPSATAPAQNAPTTAGNETKTTAPTAKQAAPLAAAPNTIAPGAAAPMSAAMLAPTDPTDRMVASFSQETAKEAMIAQENDAASAQALSSQESAATDPIQ